MWQAPRYRRARLTLALAALSPMSQRAEPGDAGDVPLEQPGRVYAVYFRGADQVRRTKFAMDLPKGRWQAEWLSPRDGSVRQAEPFTHTGGGWLTETPDFSEDIALRLKAVGKQEKMP